MYRFAVIISFLLILLSSAFTMADEISSVSYCTSCHGTNGAGPGESIPYISGQSKDFLATSMKEMRDGTRYATLMQTLAKGYNDEEIEVLAAWFAAREWVSSTNEIDEALAAKGAVVAKSCVGCHGKNGEGMGEFPRIAGQPAEYLNKSLQEYKQQVRNNDAGAMMMFSLVDMSDEDILALAEYYSGIK